MESHLELMKELSWVLQMAPLVVLMEEQCKELEIDERDLAEKI